MQTLLFIRSKLNDEDVEKINEALLETRVVFRIKKAESLVVIEGRNDIVYAAKVTLRELGYDIE